MNTVQNARTAAPYKLRRFLKAAQSPFAYCSRALRARACAGIVGGQVLFFIAIFPFALPLLYLFTISLPLTLTLSTSSDLCHARLGLLQPQFYTEQSSAWSDNSPLQQISTPYDKRNRNSPDHIFGQKNTVSKLFIIFLRPPIYITAGLESNEYLYPLSLPQYLNFKGV